ncbi:MAG: hypothetical protein QG656_661 [Candidatus Hydrogenedentes bacterium]|nr:hypothetical protein [Candidatus Hydrogenedentota bacterium]
MTWYVNGEAVEAREIEAEIGRLRPHYERAFADQPPEERERQLGEWGRENVIERALLRQAALRDEAEVPAEDVEKAYRDVVDRSGGEAQFLERVGLTEEGADAVKSDIAQSMKYDRFMKRLNEAAPKATEAEARAYYRENLSRFMLPPMIRASHIVKRPRPGKDAQAVEQELLRIREEVRKGACFDAMAQQHSDCADGGGDLGYFARGRMVPAFEEVVFSMKVGELSGVFETEFGFHIAQVTDKRPAGPCPFEEAHESIVQELTQQRRQTAIEDYIDAIRTTAVIEEK